MFLFVTLVIPFVVALAHGAETGYQIPWDAYASGGEQMTSSHYGLNGMAGQSIVGGTSNDSGKIGAGFWTVFTETLFMIFLPLILR